MWQQLVVAPIVTASAGYAAWAVLPAGLRRRLGARVRAALGRMPGPVASLARRVPGRGAQSADCGCAACPASAGREGPPHRR